MKEKRQVALIPDKLQQIHAIRMDGFFFKLDTNA